MKFEVAARRKKANALVHAYIKFLQAFSTVLFGFRNARASILTVFRAH